MTHEASTSFGAANAIIPVVPVAVRRLFVGNLGTDGDFTDEHLARFYGKFGPLTECRISIDRRTGKSRGFGFVTFKYEHSADKALETLPHFIIDRRVSVSRMKSESTVVEPLIKKMQSKQLYVCHMPGSVAEEQLRAHFSQFGNVVDVDMVRDMKTDETLGYSLISFDHPHAVEYCLRTLDSHRIGDCRLHIRKAVTAEAVKKAQQSERERMDYENRCKTRENTRYAPSGDRHTSYVSHRPSASMMFPVPTDPLTAAGYGYQPVYPASASAAPSRDQRLAALYDTSALYPNTQG
ncbi:hypothetical protein QR680_015169 [Steinernema hermaphroditum]|uniref:RRM domain-containing protein n=1 Tax=Steinernema hermaphroditum TaxID=289476 RepID=A0AA39ICT8_9BILA|nr:hypothetical protein QR680_015169 [Steinernema hermaphroditum]